MERFSGLLVRNLMIMQDSIYGRLPYYGNSS